MITNESKTEHTSDIPMVRLGDIINVKTGKLDANAAVEDGKYPFFTTAKEIFYIDTYSYDDEVVLVAGNGDLNVKYYSGKFDAYQRTYILTKKENMDLDMRYLYYFMDQYIDILRQQSIGAVIKYIKLGNITEAVIPLPSLEHQKEIVKILDQAQMIIEKRKSQLQLLNELKHSIFYEMFGKSMPNTNYFLSDVLEFIDGDRGKNYPKQEDFSNQGYCLFLNTKNVTFSGFNFNKLQFISKEKDESMSKGKLQRGDIVLTTRGTLGNTAYYSKTVPFENIRINSGMVILRINRDIIFPKYLMDTIKYTSIFSTIKSGTAQKQLSISKMRKVKLYIPRLKEQEYYENLIDNIEDKEHKIHNSFKEIEILMSSLTTYLFSSSSV